MYIYKVKAKRLHKLLITGTREIGLSCMMKWQSLFIWQVSLLIGNMSVNMKVYNSNNIIGFLIHWHTGRTVINIYKSQLLLSLSMKRNPLIHNNVSYNFLKLW